MEELNAIFGAIGTLGFPIVACCGLFWFANKLVDKITTVISENTLAITELKALIEKENEANAVDK